jgi:hypothetical protein
MRDTNAYADRDSNSYAYTDSYANCDVDANSHCNNYTFCEGYSDAKAAWYAAAASLRVKWIR